LIGERVRDKIAASKRKGLWVGGPVPLGYAVIGKKITVVPGEAEAVRSIFARYLELGSVRALADDLDRRGIRSKTRKRSDGATLGGGRFGVGALAYLLKNQFYMGKVVYRGEVHGGEQEPIVDRALFAAVQEKLAAGAVRRRCRLRGSPAILTGRIFDDHGRRMSPTHSNKNGLRYRYYVSGAALGSQPQPAGPILRVPAAEIEALVIAALRSHRNPGGANQPLPDHDRDLIEHHVERVTLTPHHIKLRLVAPQSLQQPDGIPDEIGSQADPANNPSGDPIPSVKTITIPWTSPLSATVKGVIYVPAHNTPIPPGARDKLLLAIAKARTWIDDLAERRVASFAAIANREGKAERHVRRLAPLAFLSPRIITAVIAGTAPAGLTIAVLARVLPYSWAEQERRLRVHLV
jgi:site-specific DNA recombinase